MIPYLCPHCCKEMIRVIENYYECFCGHKIKQISLFEKGEENNENQ